MKSLLIAFTLLILITLPELLLAQPPGLPGDPDQAPIDGGLGILAALGGAYAVKKLRDKRGAS